MPKKKKNIEVGAKFNMWFSAQFGGLPRPGKLHELMSKRQNLEAELAALNAEIQKESTLERQYTAARYAHNAKDSGYEF